MIPESKIDPALQEIEKLFTEHCENGAQSRDLKNTGAACGQFVGPAAKERPQRGLHGTAAALRVLAQAGSVSASKLVPQLVWYIQNRPALHDEGKEPRQNDRTFEDDQQNVIKLSEVLYGLSYVKVGQGLTDNLVREIAEKLLGARKEKKGWTYFLSSAEPVDILPTAFAVLALSQHGYEEEIRQQIEFLKSNVFGGGGDRMANVSEASVRIFCLFALAFRNDELSPDECKQLKRALTELWDTHKSLLDLDLEQGIEYANGAINYYIRIPWQLYLLALAARLNPTYISSLAAQRKLNQILDAVKETGFRYPYSGTPLSSRTNAILFDVLHKIKRYNKRNIFHTFYYVYDSIRTFFSRRIFSWLTLGLFVSAFAFFVYAWVTKSGKPEDLGPDLVGATIGFMIAFSLERIRKSR
jgi:hypothetical protein